MYNVSNEHEKIVKLWDEVIYFPLLHSQVSDWLSNSRHKKIHIYPFHQIFDILELAVTHKESIKKNCAYVKLCSFNLSEKIVENRLSLFELYRNRISVENYSDLKEFIEFSNETKKLIETHMARTYTIKNKKSLLNLLNIEYLSDTDNYPTNKIIYILYEIYYNLEYENYEFSITNKINEAIQLANDLGFFYKNEKTPDKSKSNSLKISLKNKLFEIKYFLESE